MSWLDELPEHPSTIEVPEDIVSPETFTIDQVSRAVAAAIEAHAAGNDAVEAATAVLTT